MAPGRCSLFRATRAVFLQGMATAASIRYGRRSSTRNGGFRSSRGASCEANRPWAALFRTAPIGSHCRQSAGAVHVVIPPPRSWSAPPRCCSSCERRCFSPLRSASQGPDGRVQRQRRKHGSMELRLDLDGAHAAPLWPSRGWRRRCRAEALVVGGPPLERVLTGGQLISSSSRLGPAAFGGVFGSVSRHR